LSQDSRICSQSNVRDRWIEQFFSVVGVSFAQADQAASGSQIMVQTVARYFAIANMDMTVFLDYVDT
jgi:hypothetical protein